MIFKNLKHKTCNLKFFSGFTLVEMMVVISVIGILYLIVFGSVSDSKARGRDAKRIADIGVIQLSLERYYDEFKKYPDTLATLADYDGSVPTKDSLDNDYKYSTLIDTNTNTCSSSCQSYHLGATLELDNNVFTDDWDENVGFYGSDDKDCENGDTGKCYDVVPKF